MLGVEVLNELASKFVEPGWVLRTAKVLLMEAAKEAPEEGEGPQMKGVEVVVVGEQRGSNGLSMVMMMKTRHSSAKAEESEGCLG